MNPEFFNRISKKPQKYDVALLELEANSSLESIKPLKLNLKYDIDSFQGYRINISGYSGHYNDYPNVLYCE